MKKPIYLDNAATTAARPEVIEAMLPYFGELYGNPSTVYSLGASSKQAEENARGIIAGTLGTDPKNIYFTAGGSESTTGLSRRRQKRMQPRENILLPARSSIMRYCILVNIWRSRDMK